MPNKDGSSTERCKNQLGKLATVFRNVGHCRLVSMASAGRAGRAIYELQYGGPVPKRHRKCRNKLPNHIGRSATQFRTLRHCQFVDMPSSCNGKDVRIA